MPFDYKKEFKVFYAPKACPEIIRIPAINFVAVNGSGDPNEAEGAYQQAIRLLYGVSFTIKMSKKTDHHIEGYFDYVVPPLEGFWWQPGLKGFDRTRKEELHWISIIRLPDFVTKDDFDWAITEATRRKKTDFSKVDFLSYDEGLCVQCLHVGSYDNEPETVQRMHDFIRAEGYTIDITDERHHHEIYLSDPRKAAPEKRRTILRLPIKSMV